MNEGGRPSAAVIAKSSVSLKPITSIVAEMPIVSCRSTCTRQMCVMPAETSRRKWCSSRRGGRLGEAQRDSAAAERMNVAASTSATVGRPRRRRCGAGERRDEAQALAQRLKRAVRLPEQLVGQHRLHHRAAR